MSIDHSYLKSIVYYNHQTGEFIWLPRKNMRWNGRFAGKRAGAAALNGYRTVSIDLKRYYEHRLAWFYSYSEWPSGHVDHINGDRADNRIANLRLADKSQNAANSKIKHQSSTGLKGAFKNGGGYCSRIKVNGESIYLGQFLTAEAAHAAYVSAAEKHFGEFARSA